MARIREIAIDAVSPADLAAFWAAALDGYSIRPYDDAEIARLASIGRTPASDPAVAVDGSRSTCVSGVRTNPAPQLRPAAMPQRHVVQYGVGIDIQGSGS